MNKSVMIKICVLIFAVASIHLFSFSHSQVFHESKVIADHESQQLMTSHQYDNEDKFLFGIVGNAELILGLLLFMTGMLLFNHLLQNIRQKGFMLAEFYQSSYLGSSFVRLPQNLQN